jgi:exonuclease SbcC
VLETDGVSVGRFQELLSLRRRELLNHWDLERQRPERKRSGDARWSRERGTVLEAQYALEDAESRFRQVREKEEALEAITENLEACSRETAETEKELHRIEGGAKDAEKRRALETRHKETELSLREVRKHYEDWTKYLLRREAMEGEIPELEKSVETLEQEKIQVQTYLEKKELVERFRRVQAGRERLEQAEAELGTVPALPLLQLERLRQSAADLDKLQTALQAGNLSLSFRSREAADVVIQRDMDEPAEQHLSTGEELCLEASGKIEMRHPQWSLEVYSGRGEFTRVAEQYEQARSDHARLLEELKVGSAEEAVETSRRYESLRAAAQTARAVYEQELGGDTFAALQAACGETPGSPPAREQSQVLEDLVEKRSRLQKLKQELAEVRTSLADLEDRYGDKETLFARVAELGGIQREIAEKISGLSPLPQGYGDAQSLLDHYNGLTQQLQSVTQRRIRLESDFRNAEASLPDESSEEAARRVEEVREELNAQLKKAEILVRIQKVSEQMLGRLDKGVYGPFIGLVKRYLEGLSNKRYGDVPEGQIVPGGVVRRDGKVLDYDLLSAGTKDLFALALRLAMAEFILGGREGFLLLDDPLVDLDPERQKRAAATLEDFADKQQLVVFTCQPAHAALFGEAHRIELERI